MFGPLPARLVAHIVQEPLPPFTWRVLLTKWSFEPLVVIPIVVVSLLYWLGLRRLKGDSSFPPSRIWAFAGGIALLVVALMSPVDTYADSWLSIHMVQHILLMFLAAPLLALGTPVTLALRAAAPSFRKRVLLPVLRSRPVEFLGYPLVGAILFTSVLYVTHFTGFYNAALQSNAIHALEHALYLGVALLFWWPIVGLDPSAHKPAHAARLLYLVLVGVGNTFLSVALLSANRVLYPHYANLPPPWGGAAALSDQGNAASIMWVFGGLIMIVAVLLVAGAWFRQAERRQRRIEEDMDARAAGQAGFPERYEVPRG